MGASWKCVREIDSPSAQLSRCECRTVKISQWLWVMFYKSYRRQSKWTRLVYVAVFVFFLDIFRLMGAHRSFSSNLITATVHHIEDLPREVQNQQIYITAQFWTSEAVLIDFWLTQFLKLVKVLGKDNVYVSIIESGSLDNTADPVRWLHQELVKMQVPCKVITDPTTHADAIAAGPLDEHGHHKEGWIVTPDTQADGTKELRRIPYLANLRNWALQPMLEMHRKGERTFDKILYLNDVYFEPSDILTLLSTNDGFFDVACGLDFHLPPAFYDTFALRDTDGRGAVMSIFPYFRGSETRNALLNGRPSRVSSCWNGVLAVDAAPYYDVIKPSSSGGRSSANGLRFRGIPDSLAMHLLEASECCLIHADLIANGQAHKGIYLNPAVRTGYDRTAYELTHVGADKGFVTRSQYILGVWKNRFARWKWNGVSDQNIAKVRNTIKSWSHDAKAEEERIEVGGYCTINEMHILIPNGWKHVWADGSPFEKQKKASQ